MSLSVIVEKIRNNAIAKDSSWAIVGSAIGKALTMVAGIVIARLLGAEIYGEYGMIKSTLVYGAIFSTFGLGYTTTKYIAQCKAGDAATIRGIIISSINITVVTSILLSSVLLLLADNIPNVEPHLVPALRYTAFIIVFNAVNTTQLGLLAGFKDFRAIAINSAIAGLTTLVLSSVMTYFIGLEGAVLALFTSTIVQCTLNHIAVRKHYNKVCKSTGCDSVRNTDKPQHITRELLKFSLPVALQESIFSGASWLRIYIILTLAGADELGLYTASQQWYIIILFIPNVLRNVILSHLSSSADDHTSHERTFSAMLRINIAATTLPAILFIVGSPIIDMLYGDNFTGLNQVLVIAIAASIFTGLASIYTQEFISRSKNWTVLVAYALRDGGSLAVAYPLMARFGDAHGASIMYGAILVSHVLYCIVLHIKYNREFKKTAQN